MSRDKREIPVTPAKNPVAAYWAKRLGLTPPELHQKTWDAANFATVAAITSGGIVSVQSPLRSLIASLSLHGTFLPPSAANVGFLSFMQTLYRGTAMSLKGSVARTVYVTGVKNNKPVEVVSEEYSSSLLREEELMQERGVKKLSKEKLGFVASASFGDMLVNQVPGSYSTLQKIPGLMPKDFKWYTPNNFYHLMKGGFVPGYMGGLVNFAALCVLEGHVANALPIKNKKAKHFFAGALSGSAAAFFSYPFAVACDYTIVRATITDGQLTSRTTLSVVKELFDSFKSNPKQAAQTFFGNAAKQLPIRMALTAMIYSIISGVGETLGTEPLKRVVPLEYQPGGNPQGFFGKFSEQRLICEEVSSAEDTHSSTQTTPTQVTPKGPN
ncbi:hypothetical protein [Legionella tunisiensis]|uniref:hypothetical protein n=1 Tax=Legionella tunisiensis TaxID=1034944 RepID=UPI0003070981|nr:hypothetical protein [Legionella tunisiensis]